MLAHGNLILGGIYGLAALFGAFMVAVAVRDIRRGPRLDGDWVYLAFQCFLFLLMAGASTIFLLWYPHS